MTNSDNLDALAKSLFEEKQYVLAARSFCILRIFKSANENFRFMIERLREIVASSQYLNQRNKLTVLYYWALADQNIGELIKLLRDNRSDMEWQRQFVTLGLRDYHSKANTISRHVSEVLHLLIADIRGLYLPSLDRIRAYFAIQAFNEEDDKVSQSPYLIKENEEVLRNIIYLDQRNLTAKEAYDLGFHVLHHLPMLAASFCKMEESCYLFPLSYYKTKAFYYALNLLVTAAKMLPPEALEAIGITEYKKAEKEVEKSKIEQVPSKVQSLDETEVEYGPTDHSVEAMQVANDASYLLRAIYHMIKERPGLPPEGLLYLPKDIQGDKVLVFMQEQEGDRSEESHDNLQEQVVKFLNRFLKPAKLAENQDQKSETKAKESQAAPEGLGYLRDYF